MPTKAKIQRHILAKTGNNTFWSHKYKYVHNNLCLLCGWAPETINHLHSCKDPRAVKIRSKMAEKLSNVAVNKLMWVYCSTTSSAHLLNNFNPLLGSKELIPKALVANLKLNSNDNAEKAILDIQKIVLEASSKVWRLRNAVVFGKTYPP